MKIAMIIDRDLPLGLIANTAAALGVSLGNTAAGLIGPDIPDADGNVHKGITAINIPILSATAEQIKNLRDKLFAGEFSDVITIDFSNVAQRTHEYEDYANILATVPGEEIRYLGLCVYGPLKKVNKLTGSMPLLR